MRPLHYLRQRFHTQPRLFLAGAAGAAIGLLLPASWAPALRGVIGWDTATALYLVLVAILMATSNHDQMRRRSAIEDEGRWVILALTSGAALVSLLAIGVLVSGTKDLPTDQRLGPCALGGLTILLSWLFIHTLYAVHYAYDHYRDARPNPDGTASGGLSFPGARDPDYWDFCYFSFTIGMTAQTSDVAICGCALRRLTLVHGIISFCFNTILLALTINIAAGLL
jgi:uncharacterized membrane protein